MGFGVYEPPVVLVRCFLGLLQWVVGCCDQIVVGIAPLVFLGRKEGKNGLQKFGPYSK